MAKKPREITFLPKPKDVFLRDTHRKMDGGEGEIFKLMLSPSWLQSREVEVKRNKM